MPTTDSDTSPLNRGVRAPPVPTAAMLPVSDTELGTS